MREIVENRTQHPRYPDDLLIEHFQKGDNAFFYERRISVKIIHVMHERRIIFEDEEAKA